MKGVELEVTDGITEHSSRVALKGVFSNFGDVVACWVPPIDRRATDKASVRFGTAASAEAAKTACDSGQVFLQGMQVKCEWRVGGGRRVGNSDLGGEQAGGDVSRSLALKDKEPRARAKRSRSRRRSRSRGRRSRSRKRSRSRRRSRSPGMPALPALAEVKDPNGLPDWLQDVEPPLLGGGVGIPPPVALAGAPGRLPGAVPGSVVPELVPGGMATPLSFEEEARRRAELEAKRRERVAQMKRGPGVAALVQDALKRARATPAAPKSEAAKEQGAEKERIQKAAAVVQQVEADSDEESEETLRERREKEARERELLEREAREREERDAQRRKKAEQEARERREQARREAAEAERALQQKEAETREQRIKASVEAAKRQQAERAAAKAAKEAADNLYDNMPQPDIESEKQKSEVRMREAEQREKQNSLANLPPEDRTKVVFLDVDGVLRPARAGGFDILSVDAEATSRVDTSDFFPSAVKALRHILEKTGAVVVLSSEWRRSEALCNALGDTFEKHRLRPWAAATTTSLELEPGPDPVRQFADRRAREINQWLQEHHKDANVVSWVVLDDINIAIADETKRSQAKNAIGPRLVQTWPLCGLTMGNAKTAVRILNGEMINKVVVERPVAPGGATTPMPGGKAVSGAGGVGGLGGGVATPMPGVGRTR